MKQTFWYTISHLGVLPDMPEKQSQRIILTNRLVSIMSLIALPYIFIFYAIGLKFFSFLIIPSTILSLMTLVFNRFRLYLFARMWFVTYINLLMFGYGFLLGRESGISFLLIACVCLPWLLFELRRWGFIVISVALSIGLFYAFEFIDPVAIIKIPAGAESLVYHGVIAAIFAILVICMSFLTNQNEISQKYLITSNEALSRSQKRMERALAVNAAEVEFAEIIRNSGQSLKQVCDDFLFQLCRKLQCGYGVIFIYDRVKTKLILSSEFAKDKMHERKLELSQGESLTGEAFQRKQTIHMKGISSDYLYINSGLGQSVPTELLIVPIKFNEQMIGVVELATFYSFSETDISMVEKIAEGFAATVLVQKTIEDYKAQETELRDRLQQLQKGKV